MSKSSLRASTLAIAEEEDGSMRILPSQSSVMNDHAGSTSGFTTSRSRPWRSPIAAQYSTDAPPSGSAPMRTPAFRMASMSMMEPRSST